MAVFTGQEWTLEEDDTLVQSATTYFYQGRDVDEAVENCLYMEQLKNGSAFIGPSGRVVHNGNRQICFPTPKPKVFRPPLGIRPPYHAQ